MKKEVIKTDKAPAPIGPYNQAVKANGMVYISGQIAIDPATGNLEINDLDKETHLVMANLKAVLEAAGSGFDQVVKSSIFLKNMDDFAKINEIYGSYFTIDPPARETVQVAKLPKDVNVEISVIALAE